MESFRSSRTWIDLNACFIFYKNLKRAGDAKYGTGTTIFVNDRPTAAAVCDRFKKFGFSCKYSSIHGGYSYTGSVQEVFISKIVP